eukprot:TRINITY_DN10308_c0_g1_i1.p1 TRINITY_DN10308_c0_g1~~TRINITY_DN10308_c0_g1_i1.p1  ORF type:complete len:374 (-),score=83.38 TRINITY_DN10308_c0_g1_i1:95-1141(-)
MAEVSAFAALQSKAPVVEWKYQPRDLKDDEVEIDVTHCGVCHTDVSQIDNDWGGSKYPLVPGHEIIGIVTKVGERVDANKFFPGLRVGLGPQRDCCRSCKSCQQSDESACLTRPIWTYNSTFSDGSMGYGGFSKSMRVFHRFLHPIPDAIPSTFAPLLCAGITTFFPFTRHNLQPGSKVGIIGVGGLGHLALQFSSKMGYETTAISTTASKEAEAKSFGAHNFLLSSQPEAFKKEAKTFDMVFSTASSNKPEEDLSQYLSLLRPGGTFVLSGIHGLNVKVSSLQLIGNRISIEGSNIGGSVDMNAMLNFSALHKITPQVEVLPWSRTNEALDKVRKGTARYRMVLTDL